MVAHHRSYAALVKRANEMESGQPVGELANGIRADQLALGNSLLLHECYFGNLGGSGRMPESVEAELLKAYGGIDRWEELFRTTGRWLANGDGWVVLDCNLSTGDLRTYWCGDHSRTLSVGRPLLVMDMNEHSYRLDFGSEVDRYIEAFFKNIEWDVVARRLEGARCLISSTGLSSTSGSDRLEAVPNDLAVAI